MSRTSVRTRVEFPAPVVEESKLEIFPLVFSVNFSEGRTAKCDLEAIELPAIARILSAVLKKWSEFGNQINSPNTLMGYTSAIRSFCSYLSSFAQPAELAVLADVKATHLDGFENNLREKHGEESRTAHVKVVKIVCLLRGVEELALAPLNEDLVERLSYAANGVQGENKPRDSYSAYVVAQLEQACKKEISEVVSRITVEGEERLGKGLDPRVAGWRSPENVLWEVNRIGTLPFSVLKNEAGKRAAGSVGLRELNHLIYPSLHDLLPFMILFLLKSGMEMECAAELDVDCLKNSSKGFVDIRYLKRRARGSEHKTLRVRDGGSSTPGGIIKMVLRLTKRLRQHSSSKRLWLYFAKNLYDEASFSRRHHSEVFDRLIERHNIVDDNGEPVVLTLSRLRKTFKAEVYRQSGGMLDVYVQGHSKDVAVAHYAEIPALQETHESTVAEGLQDAFKAALGNSLVISPEEEQRLKRSPALASEVLGIKQEEVSALLSGDNDVWLSSCSNFYSSPYANEGEACPTPFWGCLDCKNAVITSRKLPAIFAFLSVIIKEREVLEENEWALKFGRAYLRIVQQILPAFPDSTKIEARAIAEAEDVLYLPADVFAGGVK